MCDKSTEAKEAFEEEAGPRKSPYGNFHGEFNLILIEISLII